MAGHYLLVEDYRNLPKYQCSEPDDRLAKNGLKEHNGFSSFVFVVGHANVSTDQSTYKQQVSCQKINLSTVESFAPKKDTCYWIDGTDKITVKGQSLPVCW